MGETIRNAVQLALGGVLTLATRPARAPMAPALEGAYQLGRGEARSGRTMEALLAAYGSAPAPRGATCPAPPSRRGRRGQLAVRRAGLRLHRRAVRGLRRRSHRRAGEHRTGAAAQPRAARPRAAHRRAGRRGDRRGERADWEPPGDPDRRRPARGAGSHALPALDAAPCAHRGRAGAARGHACCSCPAPARPARGPTLLRALRGTDAVVGPTVPWLEAAASHARALRCAALGIRPRRLRRAPRRARAGRRRRRPRRPARAVLAPLAGLRPSTVEKLTETLRSWLLHHGRRDAVAAELFVHAADRALPRRPVREVYGDRLEDPAFVLDATLALA